MSGADVVPLLRRAWAALQQGQPAPDSRDAQSPVCDDVV